MSPERIHQLRNIFMQTALQFATMSFATRKKVGAIIVKNGSIISTGWNGLPSGMPNELIETWSDESQEMITHPLVIHAEKNAINKCLEHNLNIEGSVLKQQVRYIKWLSIAKRALLYKC